MKASAAPAAPARKPVPSTKTAKGSAKATPAKKMPSSASSKPGHKAPAKPSGTSGAKAPVSAKEPSAGKPALSRAPEPKTAAPPNGNKPAGSAASLAVKVAPAVKAQVEKPAATISPVPAASVSPVPAPKPKGDTAAVPAPTPDPKGETVPVPAPTPEPANTQTVRPGSAEPGKPPAPVPPPEAVRRPMLPERVVAIRQPARPETFAEGDHVVYPTHGVGKVERIAVEDIAGHHLELIHITFEENRMTLRVPVAKARSAGLRKLATRKMFDEALGVLKGRARIKRTMWSRRAQEYEAKINSGDPLAIAEVVRDLHRNAGQPDQSFSERQIYEAAMDRLAAELAALDQTDKATAATKLADFLKTV
jgi:CarD family transcriptional regulator